MGSVKELHQRIQHKLWEKDLHGCSPWQRSVLYPGRVLYVIAGKFADGMLTLRATSLVYTTLLSLVPLLAVSFGVLGSFGVHDQLEPTLLRFLDPLGERKIELVTGLVKFVENLRVGGVLSSLGIVMLLYTIVSMTHKVETAFNDIWHVANPRSLARRFSDYLSVIIIGPVLLFAGLKMTWLAMHSTMVQWLATIEPLGTLLVGISRTGPYLLVCAAFAFLYGFIPNTRVKLTTALVGGVFTGVLWSTTSIIFAHTVANSSNYSAIYASFAGVVLFIVWLYFGWLIILVGAQVTFYWQNPRFLDPRVEYATLSNREREEVALELMVLIGHSHFVRGPLWTSDSLQSYRPEVPLNALLELLQLLQDRGLIVTTNSNPGTYLPARDIETIHLKEILIAVRGAEKSLPSLPSVNKIMAQFDQALDRIVGGKTVEDLVLEGQDPATQRPRPTLSRKGAKR